MSHGHGKIEALSLSSVYVDRVSLCLSFNFVSLAVVAGASCLHEIVLSVGFFAVPVLVFFFAFFPQLLLTLIVGPVVILARKLLTSSVAGCLPVISL